MSFMGGFKKDKHVAAGFSVFALLISLRPPENQRQSLSFNGAVELNSGFQAG